MSLINGKAYDWASVDLKIDGKTIDIQEISYDDELEKETVHGLGSKARGYGTGNYKVNVKTVFLREDYEDLLQLCKEKGKDFYKMVVDKIVISYANDNERIVTDTITKLTPTKRNTAGKQGEKNITVDIEWVCFGELTTNGVKSI